MVTRLMIHFPSLNNTPSMRNSVIVRQNKIEASFGLRFQNVQLRNLIQSLDQGTAVN